MAYGLIPPGTDPNGKTAVRFSHIPHLEHPRQFLTELLPFLAS